MAVGKISDRFFSERVRPHLGARRNDVIVGPHLGTDAAVIDQGNGRVMVVAEDPIFLVPGVTIDDFGWYTVHIGASDVAVTGVVPSHMTYSLLLPPDTGEETIAEIVRAVSDTAKELGIAIVGGHTGYAPVVVAPTIGGITVFGWGDRYASPAGAREGDDLLITKGPAIEAAGILARQYREELLAGGVAPHLVARAAAHIRSMSVVQDALTAFAAGEVHAMHDATEGGLVRGSYEMAESAAIGLRVERDAIVVPEEIAAVCSFLNIDPLHSISEGTLVAAVQPDSTAAVLGRLHEAGIPAWKIGRFTARSAGIKFTDGEEIRPAAEDPFWNVFFAKLAAQG
ncbi:MAG: AIR synthase family protein [Chloroflexi bacterium]|nr:AIR synthase family protein [Chloroflexota bacterium]